MSTWAHEYYGVAVMTVRSQDGDSVEGVNQVWELSPAQAEQLVRQLRQHVGEPDEVLLSNDAAMHMAESFESSGAIVLEPER